MAEINTGGGGGKHKGGKVRAKKMSTKIDFTPMVDLGFLLITFFMLTTTLAKPQTMELNLPDKDKPEDSTKFKESLAMTIILSANDRIYYYYGITDPKVEATNFDPKKGIRHILLERNASQVAKLKVVRTKFEAHGFDPDDKKNEAAYKDAVLKIKSDKNVLMVLIKSDDKAKYKNLVDILDEMNICGIGVYALVDITPAELDMIKSI